MKTFENFEIRDVTKSELNTFLKTYPDKNLQIGHYAEPSIEIKNTLAYVKFCVDGSSSAQGNDVQRETLRSAVVAFDEYRNGFCVRVLRSLGF